MALAATERELLSVRDCGDAELSVLARDVPVMASSGGLCAMGSLALLCGGGRIAVADVSKAGSSGGSGVLSVLPPQRPPVPGPRPTTPPSGASTEDFQLEAAAWAARDASRSRWERTWSAALCAVLLDADRGLALVGTARRALEVWDVQNDCVAASSGVLGSSPPRCLALLPEQSGARTGSSAVAMGTQAGEVLLGWVTGAAGGRGEGGYAVRATVVARLAVPLLQTARLSAAGAAGAAAGVRPAAHHAPSAGVLVDPAGSIAVTALMHLPGQAVAGAASGLAASDAGAAESLVPSWLESVSSPAAKQRPSLLACCSSAGIVLLDLASRLPVPVAPGAAAGGDGVRSAKWAAAPSVALGVATTARGEAVVTVSRSQPGDDMDPAPVLGRAGGRGDIACVWSVWGRSASVVSSGWLRGGAHEEREAGGDAGGRRVGAGAGGVARDPGGDDASAACAGGVGGYGDDSDDYGDGSFDDVDDGLGGGYESAVHSAASVTSGPGVEPGAHGWAGAGDGSPTRALPAWLLGQPEAGAGPGAGTLSGGAPAAGGLATGPRGKWAAASRSSAPGPALGGRDSRTGGPRGAGSGSPLSSAAGQGSGAAGRPHSPLTPSPRRVREATAAGRAAAGGDRVATSRANAAPATIASTLRAGPGALAGGCLAGAAPTLPLPAHLASQQLVRGLRAADPPLRARSRQSRRGPAGARSSAGPSAAVVFDGSRIRSSGYGGTAPRTALFGAGRKAKPAPSRVAGERATARAQALANAVASKRDPEAVAAALVADAGWAGAAAVPGSPLEPVAPSRWSERFRDWLDGDAAAGAGRTRAAVSGGARAASSALRRACVDRQGRVLVLGGWDGAVTTVALPAVPTGGAKWPPGGSGAGSAGVVRGEPDAHGTASAAAGTGGAAAGAAGDRGAPRSAGGGGSGAVLALATSWRSYRAGALMLRQRQAGSGLRSASDARQASVPLVASVHSAGPVCVWAAGRSAPLLTLRRRSGAVGTSGGGAAKKPPSSRGGSRARGAPTETGGAPSTGSGGVGSAARVESPSGVGFCHADRVMCVAAKRELLVYELTVEENGLCDGVQGRDGLTRCRLAADLGLAGDARAAAGGAGGGASRGVSRLAGPPARATTCLHTEQGPDGTGVLVGLSDGTVCAVDLAAGGGPAASGGFALPEAAVPRVVRAFGDLALTASMGSSSAGSAAPLLAWDLRTPCADPVAAFAGQSQRLGGPLCAGATLTRCGRFVVTGSADASAYVFDLRAPAVPLARLRGPSDAVADVCAHPLTPCVWAACSDGSVVAYL